MNYNLFVIFPYYEPRSLQGDCNLYEEYQNAATQANRVAILGCITLPPANIGVPQSNILQFRVEVRIIYVYL